MPEIGENASITRKARISIPINKGRLKWKVHVVDGLERAPEALRLLFAGAPCGKVLLRL